MMTATKTETRSDFQGVIYRTVCQNPGCGHQFDLQITPKNASMLSGTIPCPRCKRHGGMLQRQGRIGERTFAAKLAFKPVGVGSIGRSEGEEEELVF